MDVLKLVVLAVVAALLSMTLKQQRPELAVLISLAAAVMLMLLCLGSLTSVVEFVQDTANSYGISSEYISVAVKVTGIALLTELGVQLCKDAGESAIASKLELGGKAVMLTIALPVFSQVLELVRELAP